MSGGEEIYTQSHPPDILANSTFLLCDSKLCPYIANITYYVFNPHDWKYFGCMLAVQMPNSTCPAGKYYFVRWYFSDGMQVIIEI